MRAMMQAAPACQLLQTPDHLKTSTAEEAFNKNGLSQRTIRLLKDKFPDLEVCAPQDCITHTHTQLSAATQQRLGAVVV